jgi:hypothetical protein
MGNVAEGDGDSLDGWLMRMGDLQPARRPIPRMGISSRVLDVSNSAEQPRSGAAIAVSCIDLFKQSPTTQKHEHTTKHNEENRIMATPWLQANTPASP